jgi:hypothetical protein
MRVYPYTKVKFSTPLPTYEIRTMLRSYVEKVAHPAFDLYAPNTHSTFFGWVEGDNFQIYRTRFSNARPTTIVYGELHRGAADYPVRVELVYQLNFYKSLFFFLWHVLFLVMLGLLLIVPVESKWVISFPIILLVVGNRVMIRKFEADVQFFNRFFTESIKAERQSREIEYSIV